MCNHSSRCKVAGIAVHTLNQQCVLPLPGENESGKTTLIAKLQGNEDPKKGSGLEYLYINVKDEYRDGELTLGLQKTMQHTLLRDNLQIDIYNTKCMVKYA